MRNGRNATLTLAAIALLPLLYVGAYLALVQRTEERLGYTGRFRFPYYRVGGETAKRIFAPLHEVDQRVRKRYWGLE